MNTATNPTLTLDAIATTAAAAAQTALVATEQLADDTLAVRIIDGDTRSTIGLDDGEMGQCVLSIVEHRDPEGAWHNQPSEVIDTLDDVRLVVEQVEGR